MPDERMLMNADSKATTSAERRVAPRVPSDGIYFSCRPALPGRWWRARSDIAWVTDLSLIGARLSLPPTPELRAGTLWSVRVGRWGGEAEIRHVTQAGVEREGCADAGVRFLQLDTELRRLIAGYVEGTCSAEDWLRAMRS